MTDIVERLRDMTRIPSTAMRLAAADAIERLEAALKETLQGYLDTEYYDQKIVDRARAALKND